MKPPRPNPGVITPIMVEPVATEQHDETHAAVERLDPARFTGELVEAEHLARYVWAASVVRDREVLDAGCGTGYGCEMLVRIGGAACCTGIDIAPDAIESARERHGAGSQLDFRVGDVTALDLPDASVDVVTCFETIEHLSAADQEKLVAEAARVLRPGGLFIASSPNRLQYPAGNPYHLHELTPVELQELMSRSFATVSLHRQHNWLVSAVLDDGSQTRETADEPLDLEVRKLQGRALGDELYTLVVCSDGEIDDPRSAALLTHALEVRRWMAEINLRDELLARANERINDLGGQLARTREALGETERELLELRDRRSVRMAELERHAYWLERGRIDLDALMQRRPLRFLFKVFVRVVRFRRRLVGRH